jgi:gamma-glutamylcyclotransferase (GGCT)/AIG2-like uncharacterized protein YtfP
MAEQIREYLFSYGTLQHQEVQKHLFGRILQGAPDTLRGYTLSHIIIRDETFSTKAIQESYLIATVSANPEDAIAGYVFTLSAPELSAADSYEPREYKRIKVSLESGMEAWVYVAAF